MLPSYVFGTLIAGSGQKVAFTTNTTAAPISTKCNGAVRLMSSVDCFVEFGPAGSSPPATTTTSHCLPANRPEYFGVSKGTVIAVVQAVGGGNLYISEV